MAKDDVVNIDIYVGTFDSLEYGNYGCGGYITGFDNELMFAFTRAKTTKPRAVLRATLIALKEVSRLLMDANDNIRITVHSDQTYVTDGLSKWLRNWKNNEWRLKNKEPVKNADLWQKVSETLDGMRFPVYASYTSRKGVPQMAAAEMVAEIGLLTGTKTPIEITEEHLQTYIGDKQALVGIKGQALSERKAKEQSEKIVSTYGDTW